MGLAAEWQSGSANGRELHQTGEPRGLSPSGGKTLPTRMSHELPRAFWRGSGCRGSLPARPASREACRRAAVKPSQPACPTSSPAPNERGVRSRGSAPCCRVAAYLSQPTGNHTRPASREACRRAAVKPRPTGMSHEHPARQRRAVRGKGYYPLKWNISIRKSQVRP